MKGLPMNATPGFRRVVLLATVVAGLVTLALPTRAQDIPGYPVAVDGFDPREVAMLPGYCKYTQYFRQKVPGGDDANAVADWRGVLGPTFEHIHHYCFALMKTNRAILLARGRDVRQRYLSSSIEELDYVIGRAPQDFVLMPEILTKKGENLIRLDKGPVGLYELMRATELKPDYWPAYAQMSDYYAEIGERAKAREMLEAGLLHAPDAAALKRRLAALDRGGKTTSRAPATAAPN